MMNLDEFYASKNIEIEKEGAEGYSQQVPKQCERLKNIVNEYKCNTVLEIGFNSGHSSEIFLDMGKQVLSFDLCRFTFTHAGKQFLDSKYPGKHVLLCGNSLITVPTFSMWVLGTVFDLIFIDGGHSFECAMGDIMNCKKYANKDTIVVLDDTTDSENELSWNVGPNQAWKKAIDDGIIEEIAHETYESGRGQSWGRYI